MKGSKMPELPKDIDEKKAGSLYAKTDLIKAMSEYLNDALPEVDHQEDHTYTNIRILLCMVCCAFGLYAQFGNKFPKDKHNTDKDRLILAVCVMGYFVCSGVLTLFDYFIVKQS